MFSGQVVGWMTADRHRPFLFEISLSRSVAILLGPPLVAQSGGTDDGERGTRLPVACVLVLCSSVNWLCGYPVLCDSAACVCCLQVISFCQTSQRILSICFAPVKFPGLTALSYSVKWF